MPFIDTKIKRNYSQSQRFLKLFHKLFSMNSFSYFIMFMFDLMTVKNVQSSYVDQN